MTDIPSREVAKSPHREIVVIAAYTVIALTVFPVFPHFVSPNEMSRWLVAASIVDRGTIEVTALAPMFGGRFEDLSVRDGKVFSNKAPGVALLGVPGYLISRLFVGPPSSANLRPSVTAMRLIAATLPLLALAFCMSAAARSLAANGDAETGRHGDLEKGRPGDQVVPESPRPSDSASPRLPVSASPFATFVLLFATPLLAYGLLLFAHALTAACLFVAWALLFAWPGRRGLDQFAAGALIGLAVISEYPLAITIVVFVAVLLWERRYPAVVRFIAGGVPFAIGLAIYNTAAFGGPFQLSSAHEKLGQFRDVASTGLFGIGLPSPVALFQMLFGLHQGLFVFSPILLVGLAALPVAKRVSSKGAFVSLVALPASIVLIYCGYANWHGGWGVGPRYLTAAIPFLVFPLYLRRNGPVAAAVAGFSCAAVVLSTLVFPFIPNAFAVPWATFAVPLLRHGLAVPNLMHLLPGPLGVVFPFVLVLIASAFAVPIRRWWSVAAGIALAICVAVGVASVRHPPVGELLQRAYVEEVYFERSGALMRLGIPLPARLIARRDLELGLPPSSWPF